MAGLLGQQQGGMDKPTPAASMPGATGADDEQPNVSPEEQQQYTQFVANGMRMMYEKKARTKILDALKGDGEPVEGLANALVTLVMRLEDSAEQAGRKIGGDIVLHGSRELLEQLADLGSQAKIHDYSEEEMESAFYRAADQYREIRGQQGKLPVDELSADMQQLLAADQQGRADDVIPGISEYAARAPKPSEGAGDGTNE